VQASFTLRCWIIQHALKFIIIQQALQAVQAPYNTTTAQALLLRVVEVAELTAPTNFSLVPSDLSTTATLILNTVDYLLSGIATENGTQENFLNDVSL
jgi:hypothetical protein